MKASSVFSLTDRLRQVPVSPFASASVIGGAAFVRAFLESYTNSNDGAGVLTGFLDACIHYPLWYASVSLTGMLILSTIGKLPLREARALVTFSSLFILVPPIIDAILVGFGAQFYGYLFDSWINILFHYLTLMYFTGATTLGMKVEITLGTIAMYLVVRRITGSIGRGAIAALMLYSTVFILFTLPVVGATLYHQFTGHPELTRTAMGAFYFEEEPVHAALWPRPMLVDRRDNGTPIGTPEADNFSVSMSALLIMVFVTLLALLYRQAGPQKWKLVNRNFRYTRLAIRLFLAGLGAVIGLLIRGAALQALGDWLALLMLGVAIIFCYLFLVWENDEEDRAIDAISNPHRPLTTEQIEKEEWGSMKWVFLALGLTCATLAGWYPFTFLLLFVILYHHYSCPPLRLKRIPILSTALIAVNAVFITMAGFYLTAGTESLFAFPLRLGLGIFLITLFTENIKNIKDIEGDRAAGINTLPALLGPVWGKRVTGVLAVIAALLIPAFFNPSLVSFALAFIAGGILYALIVRNSYKELYVCLAYFSYVGIFLLLIGLGLAGPFPPGLL
jgi:4-hydroxybenzoate polyprenyltransferase